MFYLNRVLNILFYRPYCRLKLKLCGKNFRVGHSSTLSPFQTISIGDNFFSGPCTNITTNRQAKVKIGNNVMFGPGVSVIGGNHRLDWASGPMNSAPANKNDQGVSIENDVWVGAKSIILDGAYVCEGVVIGAGTIITKLIPPYVICAGNPARIIKKRFTDEQLIDICLSGRSMYTFDKIIKLYEEYDVKN